MAFVGFTYTSFKIYSLKNYPLVNVLHKNYFSSLYNNWYHLVYHKCYVYYFNNTNSVLKSYLRYFMVSNLIQWHNIISHCVQDSALNLLDVLCNLLLQPPEHISSLDAIFPVKQLSSWLLHKTTLNFYFSSLFELNIKEIYA